MMMAYQSKQREKAPRNPRVSRMPTRCRTHFVVMILTALMLMKTEMTGARRLGDLSNELPQVDKNILGIRNLGGSGSVDRSDRKKGGQGSVTRADRHKMSSGSSSKSNSKGSKGSNGSKGSSSRSEGGQSRNYDPCDVEDTRRRQLKMSSKSKSSRSELSRAARDYKYQECDEETGSPTTMPSTPSQAPSASIVLTPVPTITTTAIASTALPASVASNTTVKETLAPQQNVTLDEDGGVAILLPDTNTTNITEGNQGVAGTAPPIIPRETSAPTNLSATTGTAPPIIPRDTSNATTSDALSPPVPPNNDDELEEDIRMAGPGGLTLLDTTPNTVESDGEEGDKTQPMRGTAPPIIPREATIADNQIPTTLDSKSISALNFVKFHSILEIGFFRGHGKEPTPEEVEALMTETKEYFTNLFSSDPRIQRQFKSFRVTDITPMYNSGVSTNTGAETGREEINENKSDYFRVEFESQVELLTATTSNEGAATITVDTIKEVVDGADYDIFISDYIWKSPPYKRNEFYETHEVTFTGLPLR